MRVYCNYPSAFAPVIFGVLQGSVPDPLRFANFSNDFSTTVSSHICLFTDCCILYRLMSKTSQQFVLQPDLNEIQEWFSTWHIALNVDNKLFAVFCTSSKHYFHYSFNGSKIEPCSSYKYLGIHITDSLSWCVHAQHIPYLPKSKM